MAKNRNLALEERTRLITEATNRLRRRVSAVGVKKYLISQGVSPLNAQEIYIAAADQIQPQGLGESAHGGVVKTYNFNPATNHSETDVFVMPAGEGDEEPLSKEDVERLGKQLESTLNPAGQVTLRDPNELLPNLPRPVRTPPHSTPDYDSGASEREQIFEQPPDEEDDSDSNSASIALGTSSRANPPPVDTRMARIDPIDDSAASSLTLPVAEPASVAPPAFTMPSPAAAPPAISMAGAAKQETPVPYDARNTLPAPDPTPVVSTKVPPARSPQSSFGKTAEEFFGRRTPQVSSTATTVIVEPDAQTEESRPKAGPTLAPYPLTNRPTTNLPAAILGGGIVHRDGTIEPLGKGAPKSPQQYLSNFRSLFSRKNMLIAGAAAAVLSIGLAKTYFHQQFDSVYTSARTAMEEAISDLRKQSQEPALEEKVSVASSETKAPSVPDVVPTATPQPIDKDISAYVPTEKKILMYDGKKVTITPYSGLSLMSIAKVVENGNLEGLATMTGPEQKIYLQEVGNLSRATKAELRATLAIAEKFAAQNKKRVHKVDLTLEGIKDSHNNVIYTNVPLEYTVDQQEPTVAQAEPKLTQGPEISYSKKKDGVQAYTVINSKTGTLFELEKDPTDVPEPMNLSSPESEVVTDNDLTDRLDPVSIVPPVQEEPVIQSVSGISPVDVPTPQYVQPVVKEEQTVEQTAAETTLEEKVAGIVTLRPRPEIDNLMLSYVTARNSEETVVMVNPTFYRSSEDLALKIAKTYKEDKKALAPYLYDREERLALAAQLTASQNAAYQHGENFISMRDIAWLVNDGQEESIGGMEILRTAKETYGKGRVDARNDAIESRRDGVWSDWQQYQGVHSDFESKTSFARGLSAKYNVSTATILRDLKKRENLQSQEEAAAK